MKPLIVGLAVAGLYLGALSTVSVYNVDQGRAVSPAAPQVVPRPTPTTASRSLFRPPLALASPAAQVTLADPAARAQTSRSASPSLPRSVTTPPAPSDATSGEAEQAGHLALRNAIAYCESRDELTVRNHESGASGKYQFLRSTWHEVTGLAGDAGDYSEAVQDAAFDKLYAQRGTSPWNASKWCWGRK